MKAERMAPKGEPHRIEDPDVEIGAAVTAKRLRFRQAPESNVEFRGEPVGRGERGELLTASGSERENLPAGVEPGVTYRDVRIRWRAAARVESRRP